VCAHSKLEGWCHDHRKRFSPHERGTQHLRLVSMVASYLYYFVVNSMSVARPHSWPGNFLYLGFWVSP
jgi:hypothetical protein